MIWALSFLGKGFFLIQFVPDEVIWYSGLTYGIPFRFPVIREEPKGVSFYLGFVPVFLSLGIVKFSRKVLECFIQMIGGNNDWICSGSKKSRLLDLLFRS